MEVLVFNVGYSHRINMHKQFLFTICLFLLTQPGSAQNKSEKKLRVALRLEGLKGEERIMCLNDVAQALLNMTYDKWDSSLYYSAIAIKEARAINFQKGLIRANIVHGDALLQFQRSFESEKYFREAIEIAEQIRHKDLLTIGHRRLGQALWYQGRFPEAIDEINATIPVFERMGNNFQVINCYTAIADIYNDWGNYEKGFEYSQKAFALSKEKGEESNAIYCSIMIGSLYAGIGDHATAFSYYNLANSYLGPCNNCYHKRSVNIMKGNLYRALGLYDSSMHYLLIGFKGNPTSTLTQLFIAETLLAQKRYDTALQILSYLITFDQNGGAAARSWQLKTTIGAAYFGKKDYDRALRFTAEGLRFANERGIRGQYIPPALKLMSAIYKEKGKADSALYYFERYAQMKDSVISDQLKGKLFEFKRIAEDERKQAQIALLKKQKQISEQQLIGGLILIVLVSASILWYVSLKRRNERLKNERMQSQLRHKATELEMQGLRAQMNPHFIFNCLSSVNRFILKNETEAASDYLTRFSRLIRLVLVHSRSAMIPLKDEIEMLKLYLDMEQLRFRNAFDYSINYSSSIDADTICIPPLLLQPFCENAIWHGLVHKEGKGHLDISMRLGNEQLSCVIEDDGVGRIKAAEYKSRSGELQKSLGLKITGERLALINKEKGVQTSYEIIDLLNEKGEAAGTKVMLSIGYAQRVEEFV